MKCVEAKLRPLCRLLPVLRDAAAATNQHAAAGSVQHPQQGGDGLHATHGCQPLREHHAGAEVHAPPPAAGLQEHQHGPQHQYHAGRPGGPLLRHGQEVSAEEGFVNEGVIKAPTNVGQSILSQNQSHGADVQDGRWFWVLGHCVVRRLVPVL